MRTAEFARVRLLRNNQRTWRYLGRSLVTCLSTFQLTYANRDFHEICGSRERERARSRFRIRSCASCLESTDSMEMIRWSNFFRRCFLFRGNYPEYEKEIYERGAFVSGTP